MFQLVQDEFFFPIAYRQGREDDKFFVHCQEKAILKLFENNLIVNVKGIPTRISMKIAVSLFRSGQVKPLDKLKEVVNERFLNRTLHGSANVLNLDSFSSHGALQEIIVDLSNQSCLSLLINVISQKKQIKDDIKTLKLAKNNLKNLKPFDDFHNIHIKVLDLTYNKISSFNEFHHLEQLDLQELFIIGNFEICKTSGYQEKLKEILPTLKRVDDVCFESPEVMEIVVEPGPSRQSTNKVFKNGNEPLVHLSDGELIKPNDVNKHSKEHFKKYENCDMWHSVIVSIKQSSDKNKQFTIISYYFRYNMKVKQQKKNCSMNCLQFVMVLIFSPATIR